MSWKIGEADDYNDLLLQIKNFCIKETEVTSSTASDTNTGDGIIFGASTTEDSVAETFTIVCTDISGTYPLFSVTGSVSGVLADASQLTPYSTDYISFTILAGATSYVVGDTFTCIIEASTAEWAVDNYDTTTSTANELIMHGIGSGSDEIYIGMLGSSDGSSYFNFRLEGFTGYVESSSFDEQPGYDSTNTVCMLCAGVSFDFYLWMSSRRIMLVPIVSTVICHAYIGWALATSTPSQNGNPLFVGGDCDTLTTSYTSTLDRHTAYWSNYDGESSCRFLEITTWTALYTVNLFPKYFGDFGTMGPDVLGNYPVFPVTLMNYTDDKVYGDLEGVYYPATNSDEILSYDIIARTDQAFICFQDTYHTGDKLIAAFELT